MSTPITIGIDNGASGSIGIVGRGRVTYVPIPTKEYLHYGKAGKISERLDRAALELLLTQELNLRGHDFQNTSDIRIFIERPFSGKFINAVVPAHRFFEATIIVMEDLELGYEVVDSGKWQAAVLGDVHGSAELKKASKLRGVQLYPSLADVITKHKDADGLLIARYYHNFQA